MSERKKTKVTLEDDLPYRLSKDLDSAITLLTLLKEKNKKYENLRLEKKYGYEREEDLVLVGDRDETDKEMENRIIKEESDNKNRKERERKEFERLKKVFEPEKE